MNFARNPGVLPKPATALALLLGLTTSIANAEPWQLAARVEPAEAGRIDGLPDGGSCSGACLAAVNGPMLAGLLAEPQRGYRFAGWQGDCETTLGPLCTLPLSGDANVVARFVPETEPDAPLRAVLLLHGDGENSAIWNKVADRQFGGSCAVVYGGVPLTRAPAASAEALHCYRVRFGYYAALDGAQSNASLPQLQSELRAAVAGLLDAQPNLKLVLAGKGRALSAARRFLKSKVPERQAVAGLLAVNPPAEPDPAARPAREATPVDEASIAAKASELLQPL
jgi:hypothetical protein